MIKQKVEIKKLPKNEMELLIEIPYENLKNFLERSARQLSRELKIPGFRPGSVPYEIALKNYGEGKILENALEEIIKTSYVQVIKDNHLEVVGPPKIEVQQAVPQNPLIYKAYIALLPKVTLGEYLKIKVQRKPISISEDEVEKLIKNLQKSRMKEVLSQKDSVTEQSKVIVDLNMYLNNVPIEGGQAKDHAIYFNEDYFIPGFKEKVLGQKKGETREFNLIFPKEHYNKNLAGKEVKFKVTIKEIYDLIFPELNDEFAQGFGQKTMADLRKLLRTNLEEEARLKEEERLEGAILDKLVDEVKVEEIPEILIEAEIKHLIEELKQNVANQGLNFEEYVKNILKKDPEKIKNDFIPEAEKRIKVALIIKAIAKEQNINVSEEEINQRVVEYEKINQNNPQMLQFLKSEESRNYIESILRNRKVINFLKEKLVEN